MTVKRAKKGTFVTYAQRKVLSPGWVRFAEAIVEKAGVLDDATADILVQAFAAVPRDKFVSEAFNLRATEDNALPIGYGQTISKPSTVARMLGLIGIAPGMRVLEIGCGSGYCAAVMAAAGAQVYAVEYVGLLAQRTRHVLDGLDFQNILIRRGDGRKGWLEHAPYDAIVVSAAFERIEPELVRQLRNPGGRMVAPVGNSRGQILTLWEAKGGGVTLYQLEPCSFVEGHAGE
jgi:protein-L-isoaspartate(D-aspartate) O-methyltransferase